MAYKIRREITKQFGSVLRSNGLFTVKILTFSWLNLHGREMTALMVYLMLPNSPSYDVGMLAGKVNWKGIVCTPGFR